VKRLQRNTVTVAALPRPNTAAASTRLAQQAHRLAVRDRPPAVDNSFGGSILPALREIANTAESDLEELGVSYREGLPLALTALGSRVAVAVSSAARHADHLRVAVNVEQSAQAARDRLRGAHPASGWSAKLLVIGYFLLVGALTEGLLVAPVGAAMGLPGNEILLLQLALAGLLTLGSVFSGWLVGEGQDGPADRRFFARVGAVSLTTLLIALQIWLAPMRGAVVAGNIKSIQESAAHGHISVTTVSAGLATGIFLTLGLVVVALGIMEGYLLHDSNSVAYRRASRALARAHRQVDRSRTDAATRAAEETVNAAAYAEYRASWVSAAHALRATAESAISAYLGEVAAHADEDTRATLYEASRPAIPLPHWVTDDVGEVRRLRAVS
jgi:hypothetical protein